MHNKNESWDLVIVGGGAAGFFTAIQCAELNPDIRILIIEKSNKLLSKVKISGGGRCNVTHACFDAKQLVENYPRGHKELLGPFYKFMCQDMIQWLKSNGVPTKIEADGRIFPMSNDSQSIIDCFLNICRKNKITIKKQEVLNQLIDRNGEWNLKCKNENYTSKNVMLATGSARSIWVLLADMAYEIIKPVPSLFTFNIKHPILQDLAGISRPDVIISIEDSKFEEIGPLLITHWGISGPAVLKLSSWAARELFELNYQFKVNINWLGPAITHEEVLTKLKWLKQARPKRKLLNENIFDLAKRLWFNMLQHLSIQDLKIADLNSRQMEKLCLTLVNSSFQVNGKSTFKEEFVSSGGIDNKQLNFKTMESKLHPNLYFAGEILNIDAITGGFNFQAAWTTSFIAANAITENLKTQ